MMKQQESKQNEYSVNIMNHHIKISPLSLESFKTPSPTLSLSLYNPQDVDNDDDACVFKLFR